MVKSVSNSDTIHQTINSSNEKKKKKITAVFCISKIEAYLWIWIIQNYVKRLHMCHKSREGYLTPCTVTIHIFISLPLQIKWKNRLFARKSFFIANSNFAFSLGHLIAISTCHKIWTPCELKNHTYHWQVLISFSLVKGILHKERKIHRFNWNNLYQLRIDTVLLLLLDMTDILGLRIWNIEF